MKHRQIILLLLLLIAFTTAASGEVAKQSDAQWYLESVMILKTIGKLMVTAAAAYMWLMDVPLEAIFGRGDEGEEEGDRSLKARLTRLSQYFLVVAIAVGLLELLGKLFLAIQGITVPGA